MSTSASVLQLIRAAIAEFGEDECGLRSAALAYFTVFALPPLLVLLVMIAGTVWDPAMVQRSLETQFAGMMGPSAGRQVREMMERGQASASSGIGAVVSAAGLLLGATGFFISLQNALNRVWEVKPDPDAGGISRFLGKRILSFGMLLGVGFLLAASLAVSAGIAALGDRLAPGVSGVVLEAVNFAVSFVMLSALFTVMFRYLPDAHIAWRDVWVGGVVTGLLFVGGKAAIGFYLGHSRPGDAFGAASALGVVLVWTYYAGLILLFGAELTQQWAKQRGAGIEPEPGAVLVVAREELVRPGARSSR